MELVLRPSIKCNCLHGIVGRYAMKPLPSSYRTPSFCKPNQKEVTMKKAVKTSSSSLKSTLSELKTHVEGYGDASANKSVREIIKAIQPAPVAKLGVSTTGKSKAAITSNKLPSAGEIAKPYFTCRSQISRVGE